VVGPLLLLVGGHGEPLSLLVAAGGSLSLLVGGGGEPSPLLVGGAGADGSSSLLVGVLMGHH